MLIDESKVNEMLSKEINEQVQKKLKQVGRDTIKNLYKDVIREQVQHHLDQINEETVRQLNSYIEIEKEYWKKEVLDSIKDQFESRIEAIFDNDRGYY